MKKLFLLVFTFVLLFLFFPKKEETALVFNDNDYYENYDYEYFYISSNKIDINTNNINNYFSKEYDIKIIGLYPNLDKIYDNNLKNKLNYFAFSSLNSNTTNFHDFINNYVLLLKNNNYIELANSVYFEGIKIDKILVYASYNSVYLHNEKFKIFDYNVKEF